MSIFLDTRAEFIYYSLRYLIFKYTWYPWSSTFHLAPHQTLTTVLKCLLELTAQIDLLRWKKSWIYISYFWVFWEIQHARKLWWIPVFCRKYPKYGRQASQVRIKGLNVVEPEIAAGPSLVRENEPWTPHYLLYHTHSYSRAEPCWRSTSTCTN